MTVCNSPCVYSNNSCFCDFLKLIKDARNDNRDAFINSADTLVVLPPDHLLQKSSALRRMALIMKNLMPASRRKRPAQFQDILLDFDGECFDQESKYFDHKELDPWVILGFEWPNANPYFDNAPRDSSGEWISSFLRCIESPRKIRVSNNIERYRLIYLVIAIKFPNMIEHIFK